LGRLTADLLDCRDDRPRVFYRCTKSWTSFRKANQVVDRTAKKSIFCRMDLSIVAHYDCSPVGVNHDMASLSIDDHLVRFRARTIAERD
jgi:hypothetical protein